MAIIKNGRLYLPPEDENNPSDRKVLHPETNIDNVVVPKSDGTTMMLKDYLGKQVFTATRDNPISNYTGKVNGIVVNVKEELE